MTRTSSSLVALVGILVAGLLAGVVFGVFDGGKDSSGRDRDGAAASLIDPAALQVARDEALAFFSLDYRTAEEDVATVLSLATGEFKEQYDANKEQVVSQVTEKKLVSTATIPDGGVAVEFAYADQARILVVVDVARTIGTSTDRLRNRARLVLERVEGRWLVSGVNQVG